MKKILLIGGFVLLSQLSIFAKVVSSDKAAAVAENFYRQNAKPEFRSLSQPETYFSPDGQAWYYVFNINNSDGFVIVSAEDAAHPILGYAMEGRFSTPALQSPLSIWLQKRGEEIDYLRLNGVIGSSAIKAVWRAYNETTSNQRQSLNSNASVVHGPMIQTTWNQSPYYNALCPGGSVTGCVATAMAQIMRYWSYPVHGTGSSSYCDCSSQGFSKNYGTLSANYGTTTYSWTNMPYSVQGNNNAVATLMYQCGVSVNMDYAPSGSGAWVIASDNVICAQNSYVNYFGYDPSTINGLKRSAYTDTAWVLLLNADLDLGRPIQYAGWDPNAGGHTWVCDGYDQNNYFHMNWGWGGAGNGFYYVNQLNPTGLNFVNNHEAVTGIIPIASQNLDAGVSQITTPGGATCNSTIIPVTKLQNFGSTSLSSCTIFYSLDNQAPQTYSWTGSLVFGQSTYITLPASTPGAGNHTFKCYSSSPNGGIDGLASNDTSYSSFSITNPGGILPIAEGFESTALPSSDWGLNHTTGANWMVTSSAAATGTHCAMINNFSNQPGSISTLQTLYNFNLSSMSAPTLTFKVAYQEKASTNNDLLQVFVSTDCGQNWNSRWARYSSSLAAGNGISTTPFVPTPSQFTTDSVNLVSVYTSTDVQFKWVFTGSATALGNNLYLDDINLYDASANSVLQHNLSSGISLFPNPSNNITNLQVNLLQSEKVGISVTDISGRTIEQMPISGYDAGTHSFELGQNFSYQAGAYFVQVSVGGKITTIKLIIQK